MTRQFTTLFRLYFCPALSAKLIKILPQSNRKWSDSYEEQISSPSQCKYKQAGRHLATIFTLLFIQGCATLSFNDDLTQKKQRDLPTQHATNAGFNSDEAKQMLEFCIELNNQDDRNKPENKGNQEFVAQFGNWKIDFDSRMGKGDDPTENGFGPFSNAWILLHNQRQQNQYSIAIRGTIADATSILNDALATTIAAHGGIEFPKNTFLPITFAATPRAEVHLGFAYGAFTILFHQQLGILAQLQKLPGGSDLYITGHSQGAAIATLVHAFLYYAITDPTDRYGLKYKHFTLKSYLFAQPKPGNAQFAFDFARIAGSKEANFVINNSLDPVPQLPLSLQSIAEAIADTLKENESRSRGPKDWLIDGLSASTSGVFWLRNRFFETVGDKVPKLYKGQRDDYDTHYFDGLPKLTDTPVNSFNYTLSGVPIPVFGLFKGGNLYPFPPNSKTDWLLQHHAISYRKLMAEQFK